jgi:hypothetical protein
MVTVVEGLYWKMPLLFAVLIAKLASPRPSRHLGLAWFTEIRKTMTEVRKVDTSCASWEGEGEGQVRRQ